MDWHIVVLVLLALTAPVTALRYDPAQVGYNLNENETAVEPKHYGGTWNNHTYNPSPASWRFPFYILTIDRYIDGDPTNNEANGTVFEHNWMTNQFRFGGDTRGLQNDLDYIQGLGIKGLYLAGTPLINMPWSGDGYGPLDFTLLDRHHGAIDDWRALITEIHNRNMYVIFDNTMATMGNLLAFGGHVNETTPFSYHEYDYVWKSGRRYHDFQPGDAVNHSCQYPRMWGQDGYPVPKDITDQMDSCRISEFDMYGDIKGTGAYPTQINQLSKFAGVQDRLREWRPDVLEKIKVMSCLQIAMFDIDGWRMDKGLQTTVDAMADFADYQRECARRHGKDNFLMVGEIVGDPKLAAVYVGRGKQPDQAVHDLSEAIRTTNNTDPATFIRPFGSSALDGAAFHYDIYGSMTRFLGLDGPWGAYGVDWVEQWNRFLTTNDLVNANTGQFDPRHMYGMTNQDVFRWPALANGTRRQLLGFFVTMLELPGIPMILWGEEQEYYILENLAPDYVFGRTPMGSSRAWQLHGCYRLGEDVYVNMPFNKSSDGCHDDTVSLDHRDPSHPMRNVLKRMFELRRQYPTLNDGFNLTTLSTRIYNIYLPGSGGLPSPHGVWSVYRGRSEGVQDFRGIGQGNQGVWLIYQNENRTIDYSFNCQSHNNSSTDGAMIAPFASGKTVKNLFYPYEEYTLEDSTFRYGIEGSTELNGCIPQISLLPWDYKALVPKDKWLTPAPTITKVIPGHDERLTSTVADHDTESVSIQIHFSSEMDCESVASSLQIESSTQSLRKAQLDRSSVDCKNVTADTPRLVGEIPTSWIFRADLINVANGVHTYTINNATTKNGHLYTNARDKFHFRIGQPDNPMVFPWSANYTRNLLHQDAAGNLYISPRAAGADKLRYSTNWGSSFSAWQDYTGHNVTLTKQSWSGTDKQKWIGEHVIVHYWSQITGSSDHVQHADLSHTDLPARRWPHVFLQGLWNKFGYDGGLANEMTLQSDGIWHMDLIAEWPNNLIFNVWGMNPDGQADKSMAFGDVDGDGVLDWVPPDSLADNVVNITKTPPKGSLGYKITVNDGNYSYRFLPVGSSAAQAVVAVLLSLLPVATGLLGMWAFKQAFYQVKFNQTGIGKKHNILALLRFKSADNQRLHHSVASMFGQQSTTPPVPGAPPSSIPAIAVETGAPTRRTVLIATMEYDIEDWKIKIKIGGLGVMASLMGKNLGHQNLIWVVPCVGGVDYPTDFVAEPMEIFIFGNTYEISVQYHTVRNITYVLLDAPIFRKQSTADPYPARMDDLDSGIYYSAWNQCIAETIKRFNPDIYHINDYHGAVAPLHLLPRLIPCCLSLHNAEFQGMWSLRTSTEVDEICQVYNLHKDIVKKYVQWGEVFNLLHAGASYLRVHQKGFGAVGVSKKYGKRSLARYPIFWGLSKIGSLPNPDPTDTAEWDKKLPSAQDVTVNNVMEAERGELRKQAQRWAGLNVDSTAELFVFVGRWSQQKGVDLIADVFFSVLAEHPKTQLICVGPVIDLYGKFAALKLEKMMQKFPGRVYSKPEFTALPPYIFSGAEFALIPSRDEPFGLVAVEFGRKGALGVGARVGGLGQMPGWWYSIESTTSKHLIQQFKSAIRSALATKTDVRAVMRARSLVQRFPVAQWIEDLEKLQSTSIYINLRQQEKMGAAPGILRSMSFFSPTPISGLTTPTGTSPPSRVQSPFTSRPSSPAPSRPLTAQPSTLNSPTSSRPPTPSQEHGPGHSPPRSRPLLSLSTSRPGSSNSVRNVIAKSVNDGQHLSPLETIQSYDDLRHGAERGAPLEPPRPAWSASDTPAILSPSAEASTQLWQPPFSPGSTTMDMSFFPDDGASTPKRRLSINSIVGDQKDFKLQKVDPFFKDSEGCYYDSFARKLDSVNAKSSENQLCIEEYLVRSEKEWFGRFHRAKLGMSSVSASTSSIFRTPWGEKNATTTEVESVRTSGNGEFQLGIDYVPPNGLKKLLQKKIGDWQLYCFFLAIGQILAANSYQITLLTGETGSAADKLYALAAIYMAASIFWWCLFRRLQAVYVLASPFVLYGLAFFILGMGLYVSDKAKRGWVYNVATGIYGIASASGSLFFATNFGTEGGTPTQTWCFRACVIQGTQQLYVAFLWYWGSYLSNLSMSGRSSFFLFTSGRSMTAITTPLAILMWAIAIILFLGLPNFYRSKPGKVPSFYSSVVKRKVVLWFGVMVVFQNYWLSAPYNRNWSYLWSSQLAPRWAVGLLLLLFFGGVWAASLWILGTLSKRHSWIIPIFAIALGAPRWCQMLWGTSMIGAYIPVGSQTTGALLGRCLWLWLGVLDALQGVGFGMILLQTLTRFHIAFVLMSAQTLGALTTIVARASSPNKLGPGDVFPNFGLDWREGLQAGWFWVALLFQLVICVGFFKFFRKEQLFKP